MVRSAANRVLLGVSDAESSYGTAPTGAYDAIRFNSESLTGESQFNRSDEITSTRTTKAILLNGRTASGDITTDLYYDGDVGTEGATDKLWLACLGTGISNAWSGLSSAVIGVDSNATGNKFTASGLDGSFAVGDFIHAAGSAISANDGIYIQTAEATDEITVAGHVLQTDSGSTISLQKFVFVTNGTVLETVTVEKNFADQTTDDFHLFRGCSVAGVRIAGEVGGIATQTFSLIGAGLATGDVGDTTTSSGSYTAATTNDPYNVVDHLGIFLEGGDRAGSEANTGILTPRSFEVNVQNARRPQQVMGQATAVGVGDGSMTITGSYQQYYEDATELDKALANTASSLAIGFFDGTRGWVIDLPAIRYTGVSIPASSKDSDIIATLEFEAYEDPGSSGVMIRVGKSE